MQIKTKFWLILWTNLETNQRRTCIVWPWVKWPTRKDWRVCALQQATYRLSSTTTSRVLEHNMKLPKSCSVSILTQVCSHLRVALCWPLRLSTAFSGPLITLFILTTSTILTILTIFFISFVFNTSSQLPYIALTLAWANQIII